MTICVDATQPTEADPNKVAAFLYVNSELVGQSEVSKMNFDETNMKAYVGISCYDKMFCACYDEIHIWNRLLNESQISSMYVAYLEQV